MTTVMENAIQTKPVIQIQPVIQVENLCKSYAGKEALRDVRLSVFPGEVFGLLGANGAGKSTAMECILGTQRQDRGTVSILGLNPRSERKILFEKVGVQFQESMFQDKITVRELCEETGALYESSADYVDLLKRFDLASELKRQVANLSGGQKQRLFIVLALLPDPNVVFLDELTTGLDTRARRDVWKFLSGLKAGGLTIFLTSHFMDEVEALCDRIMILRKGGVIFHGTVEEAIASSPFENFEDTYLWYTDEDRTALLESAGNHTSLCTVDKEVRQ